MRSATRGYLTILPSPSLLWFLLTACSITLVVLSQVSWAIGWRIACAGLVVTAGIFVALRDAKLKLAHSCVAFKLEAENRITLMLRNGQYLTGDISSGGVVTPFLLLLNMKSSDYGSRNLVLLPDSMGSDDFRRLRVLLSWDKSAV